VMKEEEGQRVVAMEDIMVEEVVNPNGSNIR
jgi:hypothetical protein